MPGSIGGHNIALKEVFKLYVRVIRRQVEEELTKDVLEITDSETGEKLHLESTGTCGLIYHTKNWLVIGSTAYPQTMKIIPPSNGKALVVRNSVDSEDRAWIQEDGRIVSTTDIEVYNTATLLQHGSRHNIGGEDEIPDLATLRSDFDTHKVSTTDHVPSGKYICSTSRSDQLPSWFDIPDKPSQFPPEPHTHTREDITNFFSSPFWTNIPDKPFEGLGPEFTTDENNNLVVNTIDFTKISNRNLSLISIDVDKDWQGHKITNLGGLAVNGLQEPAIAISASPPFSYIRLKNNSTNDFFDFRITSDNKLVIDIYDATSGVHRYPLYFSPTEEAILVKNIKPIGDNEYSIGTSSLRLKEVVFGTSLIGKSDTATDTDTLKPSPSIELIASVWDTNTGVAKDQKFTIYHEPTDINTGRLVIKFTDTEGNEKTIITFSKNEVKLYNIPLKGAHSFITADIGLWDEGFILWEVNVKGGLANPRDVYKDIIALYSTGSRPVSIVTHDSSSVSRERLVVEGGVDEAEVKITEHSKLVIGSPSATETETSKPSKPIELLASVWDSVNTIAKDQKFKIYHEPVDLDIGDLIVKFIDTSGAEKQLLFIRCKDEAGSKYGVTFTPTASDRYVVDIKVLGDTYDRFRIRADGRLEWGDGTNTRDTFIYRYGESTIGLKKRLYIISDIRPSLAIIYPGDTYARFTIDINGRMGWGTGSATWDTFLYRAGSGILQTDGKFFASVLASNKGGAPAAVLWSNGEIQTYPQSADSTNTLRNSPPLRLTAKYWDGTASVERGAVIFHRMLDTTPKSEIVFQIAGMDYFAIGDEGIKTYKDILPDVDNTRNLGSTANRWSSIASRYIGGRKADLGTGVRYVMKYVSPQQINPKYIICLPSTITISSTAMKALFNWNTQRGTFTCYEVELLDDKYAPITFIKNIEDMNEICTWIEVDGKYDERFTAGSWKYIRTPFFMISWNRDGDYPAGWNGSSWSSPGHGIVISWRETAKAHLNRLNATEVIYTIEGVSGTERKYGVAYLNSLQPFIRYLYTPYLFDDYPSHVNIIWTGKEWYSSIIMPYGYTEALYPEDFIVFCESFHLRSRRKCWFATNIDHILIKDYRSDDLPAYPKEKWSPKTVVGYVPFPTDKIEAFSVEGILEGTATRTLPDVTGKLTFVSDNDNDNYTIAIIGLDINGKPVRENLTLQGTSSVTSSYSYSRILGILFPKDKPVGTITVTDEVGTTITIEPGTGHLRNYVKLSTQGDGFSHKVVIGTDIPPGIYKAIALLYADSSIADDVVFEVVNETDNTTLASTTITPATSLTFYELDVEFTGNDLNDTIAIRVKKNTTTTNNIYVLLIYLFPIRRNTDTPIDYVFPLDIMDGAYTFAVDSDIADLLRIAPLPNLNISGTLNMLKDSSIIGNMIPNTDNTYDLGSTSNRWRNIFGLNFYAGGKIVIDNNVPLMWKDSTGAEKEIMKVDHINALKIRNYAGGPIYIGADVGGNILFLTNNPVSPNRAVIIDTKVADSTNTLRDSNRLKLRAKYWDGTTSVNRDAVIFHHMIDTTPKSEIVFQIDGTDYLRVGDNGIITCKSIIPLSDAQIDIGSQTSRWRNGYFSDSIYSKKLYAYSGSHSYLQIWETIDIFFAMPQRHNILRYKLPYSIEYYDYNTNSWVSWDISGEQIVDGRYDRYIQIDYEHRTFRITWSGVSWSHPVALIIHLQWCNGLSRPFTIKIETSNDGVTWTTRNEYTVPYGRYQQIFPIDDWTGDSYVRITFDVQLESDEYWNLAEIEILSMRTNWNGNNDYPILVDGYRRITQSLKPASTNTYDLGSSSYKWRDGYFSGNIYVDGVGNLGSLQINGTEVITSDRILQNIQYVAQNLFPSNDNTYDLGSQNNRWRLGWFSEALIVRRATKTGYGIRLSLSTGKDSDFFITIQDGSGRVNMYWDAYYDSSTTQHKYLLGDSSGASRLRINGSDGFRFYTAPAGTADEAISWTEDLHVGHGYIESRTIYPYSDDSYDLGSSSKRWRDLWLSNSLKFTQQQEHIVLHVPSWTTPSQFLLKTGSDANLGNYAELTAPGDYANADERPALWLTSEKGLILDKAVYSGNEVFRVSNNGDVHIKGEVYLYGIEDWTGRV